MNWTSVCMRLFDRGQLIYYPGSFSAEWSALEMEFSLFFLSHFLSLLEETSL